MGQWYYISHLVGISAGSGLKGGHFSKMPAARTKKSGLFSGRKGKWLKHAQKLFYFTGVHFYIGTKDEPAPPDAALSEKGRKK
jgi:hypothetical protein